VSRRRLPVLVREAVAAIGSKGHAVDIDSHGTHVKISWVTNGGRRQLFVLSSAPHDRRADLNARSTLRRILAQEEQS
jgi:hypothetical protein